MGEASARPRAGTVSSSGLAHQRDPRDLLALGRPGTGALSHEYYPSSHSKTLRAAMGCPVRFAGNPGRTKSVGLKGSPVNIARRAAKAKKTRRDGSVGQLVSRV